MSNRAEKQWARDRSRMAEHVARKTGYKNAEEAGAKDWAFESQKFDNPKAVGPSGSGVRPKRRPPQKRREAKEVSDPKPVDKYLATEPSPSSDELRYTIPTLANMNPDRPYGLFNHTAEGLVNLVEQCHAKMCKIDGRVLRQLPVTVMLHNITQLYHCHMFRIAHATHQANQYPAAEDTVNVEDLERMLNVDKVLIPAEIHDWLKGLGRFKSKTGYDFAPNVPIAVVPKRKRTNFIGGDFGPVTAANHNAYETSISPLVTRRAIEAQFAFEGRGIVPWDPLPDNLRPVGMTPTANLLGYNPELRALHPETLNDYAGAMQCWAHDYMGSRVHHNSVLWGKYHLMMLNLQEKMDVRVGLPPLDKGSLATFCSIVDTSGDLETLLRASAGTLESASDLDPGTLASAAIKTYRRRRTAGAPGFCYLNQRLSPEGWAATINSSYNLVAPFAATIAVPAGYSHQMNKNYFRREITEGRYGLILEQISHLTVKRT